MNTIEPPNDKLLELVASRFRMLGDLTRLRILRCLHSGEHSVGQIVEQLEGNQPNISKHLQGLYDAGMLSRRRERNSIFYSISDPMIFKLCDLACRSTSEKVQGNYLEVMRRSRKGI